MAYVDGFILPLPKRNIETYKAMAELARTVWLDHGAREYREWIADDVSVGEVTSFPRSVLLQPDETVVIAYIVYDSREHRDAVNAKVMADPRMAYEPGSAPFDGKRMIFGGFAPLVG